MSQPSDDETGQFPPAASYYNPQPVQPLSPMPPYYPPPPPYYPPPAMYPPPLARPTSGLATASMVLGIVGVLVGWCSFGIPSVIAVFLGHSALKETKTGARGGHGMAIAGLILGYIVMVPAAALTVSLIVGSVHS